MTRAEEADLMARAFCETYSDGYFVYTPVQRAARQIAEARGWDDIVKQIDKLRAPAPSQPSLLTPSVQR